MTETPVELYPSDNPRAYRGTTVLLNSRQRLSFHLMDRDGKHVNLLDKSLVEGGEKCAQPAEMPKFDDNQAPRSEDKVGVVLQFKVDFIRGAQPVKVVGTVECHEQGQVSFILEPEHLKVPGIYLAQIIVTYNKDYPLSVYYAYITIEEDLSQPDIVGILTVPEVRMHLRDTDPQLNTLLDEYEFTEVEIMNALRKPVDLWNEALPPVAPFTTATFPFRYNWLEATCGFLLRTAAHRLRRNILQYSAGGISINDEPNYQLYESQATRLLDDYKQWVSDKKTSINLSLGFSSVGGIGY